MAKRFRGPDWSRRRILKLLSAAGVGSAVFARALTTLAAEKGQVTPKMIRQAEWISGLEMDDQKRKLMLSGINETYEGYEKLRAVVIDNSVPPPLFFRPLGTEAGSAPPRRGLKGMPSTGRATAILGPDDLAFATVTELAARIREGKSTSKELTQLYLKRLRKFDPVLKCVITYTEELALEQAERADREIAAGQYRGPLHGIPYGAKDILAVPGYRTTWGATPFREQELQEKSAVIEKLEAAGAVLVAKLSVGALAWGDVWFDGTTKNPWNTEQGSSGSSAGPASSTAAGLVGFSIGTETWGSIVSPCTRCGATGLRPTFGRVSRHGTMALAWSMDKIGPITRSVEDCALVFQAIHGADRRDPTTVDRPFPWPSGRDPKTLRIGYVESLFEEDRTEGAEDEQEKADRREWRDFDFRTLETLREIGFRLRPIRLPDRYPVGPLAHILTAEAAAAFDQLTRSGMDAQLVRQEEFAWPNFFRQGQLVPAVEYLRANRIRTLVMEEMDRALSEVDVYITPSFGGDHLLLTNLTGHPCVVLPNGFRTSTGTPTSITFMGKLFGEAEVLEVARTYQEATDYHRQKPPIKKPTT